MHSWHSTALAILMFKCALNSAFPSQSEHLFQWWGWLCKWGGKTASICPANKKPLHDLALSLLANSSGLLLYRSFTRHFSYVVPNQCFPFNFWSMFLFLLYNSTIKKYRYVELLSCQDDDEIFPSPEQCNCVTPGIYKSHSSSFFLVG